MPLEVAIQKFAHFAGGVEKAKEVAHHLGRPFVYLVGPDQYEDENFQPLEMTEEIMNWAIVVRKPEG